MSSNKPSSLNASVTTQTNVYGQVAVEAARTSSDGKPSTAWESAAVRLFPGKLASQKKGCPKGAFLGLCEEGLVSGIAPGKYTRSVLNKAYALRAVNLLRSGVNPVSPKALWEDVIGGQKRTYNNQCDVVLALWQEDLLNLEANAK